MEFFAKTLALWLVITMICCAYVLFNEKRRVKRIKGFSIFKGIIAGLAAMAFFILFLIGAITRLVLG